jgi:phospholipid/cholesterol/gamma-HCH transport system permease protein
MQNSMVASWTFSESGVLKCQGCWTFSGVVNLKELSQQAFDLSKITQIDTAEIQEMDSAGAVLLYECFQKIKQEVKMVQWIGLSKQHQALIQLVESQSDSLDLKPGVWKKSLLYTIGKEATHKLQGFLNFLAFFGEFVVNSIKLLRNPFRIQWISVFNVIEDTGYRALPIVALLLFLIGIVLTYQMGLQLRDYGANVFIVNLSGIAILREFSPLITAIIIAGRTSSSFTALISTMKVYEEIDALKVMGLSPIQRIVFPRVLGLLIALPLLTIWASIFGVLGSMIMAREMLDISFISFLRRFSEVVEFQQYWVGMSKTPVFALIISIIGCHQGFQGALSADSVGRQTTKSVVQSIFLIIIADAAFSVAYSWFGI